jgi:hypothetical protein
MWSIGWFLAGGAVSAAAFGIALLFTRRRGTPYLALDPAQYPPISEAIELLSGVTQGPGGHYDGIGAAILQNGAVYPAMLTGIASARKSLHLETFVWSTGELERRFVEALASRARAGVRVRILIDALGGMEADPKATTTRLLLSSAKFSHQYWESLVPMPRRCGEKSARFSSPLAHEKPSTSFAEKKSTTRTSDLVIWSKRDLFSVTRSIRTSARPAEDIRRGSRDVLPAALVELAALQSSHPSQAPHRRWPDRLRLRPRHRRSMKRASRMRSSSAMPYVQRVRHSIHLHSLRLQSRGLAHRCPN